MRNDLNMRKGKMVAQGAHASMKVFFDRGDVGRNRAASDPDGWVLSVKLTELMKQWVEGRFTKVCARAESEAELIELYEKALAAGLPCAMIEDAGLTEFNGVVTKTCIAIGPDDPAKIDTITGHLKLL